MKKLTLVVLSLSLSSFAFGQEVDCKNAMSQVEMNFCAQMEADENLRLLEDAVIKKCTNDSEVRTWRNGSGYNMAFANCQTRIFKALKSQLKKIK